MHIETIVLSTNGTISNSLQPSFIQRSVLYTKPEFSHGQDGRGLKTTFSIADSEDSWVTVSKDLVEHSGSGTINRSITSIFGQNMLSFYWAIIYIPHL